MRVGSICNVTVPRNGRYLETIWIAGAPGEFSQVGDGGNLVNFMFISATAVFIS
jgi:hypothetical protein